MLSKPLPGIAIAQREEGQVLGWRRLTNLTLPDVLTERRRASRKFWDFIQQRLFPPAPVPCYL